MALITALLACQYNFMKIVNKIKDEWMMIIFNEDANFTL